jgi:hypothetical protein
MIAPIICLSAIPVFYRIQDDLCVDLSDLTAKIDRTTRAVIAPHYFGFHQKSVEISEICHRHAIPFIEDCAHAFFGEVGAAPIGSYGDYALTSLWKFFPVPAGACLISAKHQLDHDALSPLGLSDDARSFVTMLNDACQNGRTPLFRPLIYGLDYISKAKRVFQFGGMKSQTPASADKSHAHLQGHIDQLCPIDSDFNINNAHASLGTFDRGLFKATSRRLCEIAERRRSNYLLLHKLLNEVPKCRPLFSSLPDEVVPFMFPVYIDELPRVFPKLEDAALPMQRFGQFLWPGVDQSVCPISAKLSHFLMQLPCHQDLDSTDIQDICTRISKAVSSIS